MVSDHVAVIHDKFFGEGVAESHHHAAFDLSLQAQRINRHTHVVGRDDFQHAHFTRQFVDFHFSGLDSE